MMGFGPSEAKQLSYWEYTAMLTKWNERHQTEDEGFDTSAPPDRDLIEMMKSYH